MTTTPHDTARDALRAGRSTDVASVLDGLDDPAAWWLRAVAAGLLGDTLATQVALRRAMREGPLPEAALADVARLYAEDVLAGRVNAALGVVAVTVHAERLGDPPAEAELVAAALCRAAVLESTAGDAPPEPVAGLLCDLAALAHRTGAHDRAVGLARDAQEVGRRTGDAEAFGAATLLLARTCADDGDRELAAAVLAHGERVLVDWASSEALMAFQEAAGRVRHAWS